MRGGGGNGRGRGALSEVVEEEDLGVGVGYAGLCSYVVFGTSSSLSLSSGLLTMKTCLRGREVVVLSSAISGRGRMKEAAVVGTSDWEGGRYSHLL